MANSLPRSVRNASMSDRGPRWRTPPSSGRSRACRRPSARRSRGCGGRPAGRRSSAPRLVRTYVRSPTTWAWARARRSACRADSAAGPRSASSRKASASHRVCADQAVLPHDSGDAPSRGHDAAPFEQAWPSSHTKGAASFIGGPFHECGVVAGGSDIAIVGPIRGYACRRGFQFFMSCSYRLEGGRQWSFRLFFWSFAGLCCPVG